jgi:hypothetical protein
MKNAKEAAVDILPALVILYGIKAWGEHMFHEWAHEHRD